MTLSNVVNPKTVFQKNALRKDARQEEVLQNVVVEIERDRQHEAEQVRKQQLLGVQKNSNQAKSDRMNSGRRRQGFVPTHKFYRSRRK